MNKTILFVFVALVIGYFLGNSGSKSTPGRSSTASRFPSYSTSSDREDELRDKMENARSNLENALSNAQDLEDRARMRWLQTGNIHDMMRMNEAEDATQSIQDAIDDLDD
jgi:hypothetical protein